VGELGRETGVPLPGLVRPGEVGRDAPPAAEKAAEQVEGLLPR